MKLHFESDLSYQTEAIQAVCDLFRGQEVCRSEFTVTLRTPRSADLVLDLNDKEDEIVSGSGNRLTLLDDEIETNLRSVQIRNGLPASDKLTGDFTVEMETGTGKTYVYLKTIFELNKLYGFTKFVIVVPSVAIKEGVNKTLEITRDHFESFYPMSKGYEFFQYDSDRPGAIRNFATSPNIQIMVVTVGAINKFGDPTEAVMEESDESRRREKSKNKMYRPSEKMGGERPIDLIRNTRPILIVDEPQSVDGGMDGKGKQALEQMKPLCTLRYSATHADKHNMIYRLDAVDAYEQKLVKQIEVAGADVQGGHNKPYVKLVSVSNKKGLITAKIELDEEVKAGAVQRKEFTVQDGEPLELLTRRAIYADMSIGEIRVEKGNELVELKVPGSEVFLRIGDAFGDVDPKAVQRQMIRRTIKEHLDKEKRLRQLGIKVLSLFFIDEVAKYRVYDEHGNPQPGEYAQMFEEEYSRLIHHPDYNNLFKEVDVATHAKDVHNGYFSIDKKKVGGKVVEVFKDTNGDTKADDDTYNLIMKKKEELLSFETPLKFIFSHSALREGWDNPNVFQICNFSTRQTERWRRQTIGRGLRLCVNQMGERVRGFEVNTLTVIATESYEDFAAGLQKDLEDPVYGIGIKFGIVESHEFAGIQVAMPDGTYAAMGFDASKELWTHLKAEGYINDKGKIQDKLRDDLRNNTLSVPDSFKEHIGQISARLTKLCGKLEVKNADERKSIATRKSVFLSPEFKALWDRIKHKTTYRVHFDNEKLIESCIDALREMPPVPRTRLQWRKADLAIGKAGIVAHEGAVSAPMTLDEGDIELPDIITELQDRTQLTRKTIVRILTESRRLGDFKANPQKFIEYADFSINTRKRMALVDGIKYQRLGDKEFYAQELFETEELTGYLKNLVENTQKSVYEHVVYDSQTERKFAESLEKSEAVKVYTKLPGWFKVPTPLGTYNPDWAIVVDKDGEDRLYFVVETKSSLMVDEIRTKEEAKIQCGKVHFRTLENGPSSARFMKATVLEDVLG